MKKIMKILAIVVVIAIIAFVAIFLLSEKAPKSNFGEIENAEALSAIINQVYAAQTMEMPMLQTQEIDVTDKDMVSYLTGLENGDNLEYAVASEPMMSSQAYSFVLVKVKDGVNTDEVAQAMCNNIDERKWICVTAEKVYTTSSGNVVCLIMSNEETATSIYETFKELAGTIGQEFKKTAEEPEIQEDMVY